MVPKMQREFKWDAVKAVVGLGNPGKEFEGTFHNAGRTVLRALAGSARAEPFSTAPRKRFSFLCRAGRLFATTSSYMNESGAAVREILRLSHVAPDELLIVHDDTDLPLGTFRLGFGRGAAGHKGVQSVTAALRTNGFWRLRMGVRPDAKAGLPATVPRVKAGDFVLRRMTARERATLDAAADAFLQSFTRHED
jgi:PTH1 family peptidyl-tRNA hydrolase